jgi:hypothetical protein
MAQLRRSIANEVETTVGSFTLGSRLEYLAATCALPTFTTATAVILSNVQDEPQSIRLATCLDRGVVASGAIALMVSPCLPWRKRLSLTEPLSPAERLALVERVAMVERPQHAVLANAHGNPSWARAARDYPDQKYGLAHVTPL